MKLKDTIYQVKLCFTVLFFSLIAFNASANLIPVIQDNFFTTDIGSVPVLLSPADHMVFEAGVTSVQLQWEFQDTEPPVFTEFKIQYAVNGIDFTENQPGGISSPAIYTLTGLTHASYVRWRICGIDENENEYCSVWRFFSIKRNHQVFVKPDGTGNGTSWASPTNLQSALNNYIYGDELWLTQGLYKPTSSLDRTSFFRISEGLKLYGGFIGNETSTVQRDWYRNVTVLSGDIGEPLIQDDNTYNIIIATGTTERPITNNTVIDGIVVENGYANLSASNRDRGAALLLTNASPRLVNVMFRNNRSIGFGGAVHGDINSVPFFYNTIFTGNHANRFGGAVLANSDMRFINCVFYGNSAGERGGAISGPVSTLSAIVGNSIIWGNTAPVSSQLYKTITSFTIVEGGHIGVGMVSGNPGLLNPENNDFRINYLSPARNAGSNDLVPEWFTTDFAGVNRISETRVDLGVFEGFSYTPFASTPEENQLFDPSNHEVELTWQWLVPEPDWIDHYLVEFSINGEVSEIYNAALNKFYSLDELAPTDMIRWRVAAVNESDEKFWSPWSRFFIRREHPLFVVPVGDGDGSSWGNAMDLQDALSIAIYGDNIWVKEGFYLPTTGTNRDVSFLIKDGISLYGGFGGFETEPGQRDLAIYQTILSGDIGEPNDSTDNSFHVIRAFGTSSEPITNATLIDGIIVEGGTAEFYTNNHQHAGGLYLSFASPVIKNSWFRNNYSKDNGGAVHGDNASNPVFANVIFSDNRADRDGGAVFSNSAMIFYNCLWYNNYSNYWGGSASASTNQTTLIYNSISWANKALVGYNDFRNIRIRNSLVEDGTGIGSISGNPLFTDAENGDFTLLTGSPAIDAGNNTWVPLWLTHDYAFNNRIIGTAVDMGPFESIPVPNSVFVLAENENILSVFPNPVASGSELQVNYQSGNGIYGVGIRMLSGQNVFETIVDRNKDNGYIHINLPAGIYILYVNDPELKAVTKLIVK